MSYMGFSTSVTGLAEEDFTTWSVLCTHTKGLHYFHGPRLHRSRTSDSNSKINISLIF